MREKIKVTDKITDALVKMAEGNPGAATVLRSIMEAQPVMGIGTVLDLDDMNIRGSQIWVAYKDHCRQDLQELIRLVNERDPGLVATVNQNTGGTEVAVTSGGSWDR